MQRLDRTYITIGLCWVVAGMIYGTWLGASNHLNFANSHAHMNLLGFVTSVVFGMLHWAYPGLGKSRLAQLQFIIYELGVVVLVIGKIMIDATAQENVFLIAGSLITIIGTAMMLYMFSTAPSEKAA
ncbi:MAG: hypothetical protein KGO53_09235 [Alphaproteobacteria bacterium]|nr:hypothetical protein [Alphaproteobacteria bacterium]